MALLELAALEYQARRGEIILLYEDETILWRFALPRAGWWRKAQRARLPTRPLSQSQIKRDESLKRQAWVQYRSWSRITSGVLLSVIGAVQYGTSKVFYKIVPHFDAQKLRQYIHQVMAHLQQNRQRGRDGRRSQRDPSGAQTRRDPRPLRRTSFASISYPPIVGTTSIPSKASGG